MFGRKGLNVAEQTWILKRKGLLMTKIVTLLTILLGLVQITPAQAEYPERAITFIVPFSVGGGSDQTARALIPFLEKHLGNGAKIAVVNKPGAGGSVAYAEMAGTKPDGYTIGMVNLPDAVTGPMLNANVGYTTSSFNYIGGINKEPSTITVKADSPVKTLEEFITLARAKAGGLTVGVPSLSNVHSVGMTEFATEAGLEVNKIPLNGGGPTMNALLGGHIDSASVSVGAAMKKKDKIRVIAQMSDERAETAPNVPTTVELGYKTTSYVIRSFAAPSGTPAPVMEKLRAAFRLAMDDPEFQATAKKQRIALTFVPGDKLVETAAELDTRLSKLWKTNPWMSKGN